MDTGLLTPTRGGGVCDKRALFSLPTREPHRSRGWGAAGEPQGAGDTGFLVLSPRRRDRSTSCVGPARSHRTCRTEVRPSCCCPDCLWSWRVGTEAATLGPGLGSWGGQDPPSPGTHFPTVPRRAAPPVRGTSGPSSVRSWTAPRFTAGGISGCPTMAVSDPGGRPCSQYPQRMRPPHSAMDVSWGV